MLSNNQYPICTVLGGILLVSILVNLRQRRIIQRKDVELSKTHQQLVAVNAKLDDLLAAEVTEDAEAAADKATIESQNAEIVADKAEIIRLQALADAGGLSAEDQALLDALSDKLGVVITDETPAAGSTSDPGTEPDTSSNAVEIAAADGAAGGEG
jgi:hypothetical protein